MTEQIICRVLTGPTASGKTAIGIQLAKEEGWDILCMDSMQIYRRMDIGTAKPTPEEMQGVPHHLMDICEPADAYSVSDYRSAAEQLILSLHAQQRNVLFIGGTVLYVTDRVVHAQYIAASPRGRDIHALDLLFQVVIRQALEQHPYFDFGISTENQGTFLNEGLIYQKEGFGARGICYDWYKWQL